MHSVKTVIQNAYNTIGWKLQNISLVQVQTPIKFSLNLYAFIKNFQDYTVLLFKCMLHVYKHKVVKQQKKCVLDIK